MRSESIEWAKYVEDSLNCIRREDSGVILADTSMLRSRGAETWEIVILTRHSGNLTAFQLKGNAHRLVSLLKSLDKSRRNTE